MGPTRISPRSLFLLRFYLQIYCLLMSVLCCGFISCTGRGHPASLKSVKLLGKYSPSIEFHFGCDKHEPNEHSQYLWVTLKSKFYLRKSSSGTIQNNNKSYAAKKILDYVGLGDLTHYTRRFLRTTQSCSWWFNSTPGYCDPVVSAERMMSFKQEVIQQ